MTRLRDLGEEQARGRLLGDGLDLRLGPVVARIRSPLQEVADGVWLHYGHHPVVASGGFADFHVSIVRPRGLRRLWRSQVDFDFDGSRPFAPLPGDQGYPLLEWGLNWSVANHCHQYVNLHAAVLERGGRALVLPAPPGSGKSTLCAALALSGWRLLSDELTLIDPRLMHVVGMPRPVSLKNASIDVIRGFSGDAVIGRVVHETTKGTVAHMRPPAEAVERAGEAALPGWIVLPRWQAGSEARLDPMPKAEMLANVISNAFNFNIHGPAGFRVLGDFVDASRCLRFCYSRLDDAVRIFDALVSEAAE